ncbi:HU family DNA-binding protein [Bacteroides sp. 51]|uniref:HU family DNA-binding protein n=1 Tax=Bacteroides sp. 51 TaxID=2302938 RepID=UPI0013D88F5C|nr:HU family DNA-binding protein [Bacteroides sp. 51]NDV83085.1 DNA-binding protein [Bacteroides sp. 51]
MSIPYVVRKKANVIKGEREEMWYAVAKKLQKKGGGVTEEDLAWMISDHTTFSRGEIQGLIIELAATIEKVLEMGRSVTIKDLGTFQTSLTSKGFKDPTQITPSEVSVSRIYFTADRGLAYRMKQVPCLRVPFKYYFPKELLTKEMQEEDATLPAPDGIE